MPKYRKVEKNSDARTAKRIYVIGALFACAFGVLASRAVAFHLKDNAKLTQVALRQYRTAIKQSSKRGRILDAIGRELAIDVTVESVWANPREIDDPILLTERLSKVLGVDRRKLLDKLSGGRKFVWVKRRISEKESKSLRDLSYPGIYTMRESSRSYPGATLAAPLLGAVGFDAEPLGGVELFYDEVLSAFARTGDVKRDARGHLYLSPTGESEEGKVSDVWLTIDRTLQFITERELAKAVEHSHAQGGSALVVDVNSGAILAAANVPTFDPNEYERYQISQWRNRAISDAYEPGSTFKTVIIAAALSAGVVKTDDVIDCEGGSLRIGSNVVHDAHSHRKLSVADVIKVSSNIGAYKIEQRLGWERAYEAIRKFGFGAPIGIDLPGESSGLLVPIKHWSELQFATIAFGQGIAATPLQMTMAFAAIANGGILYKPYIVKRIVSEGGEERVVNGSQILGHPIDAKTSKVMIELLERVTQKGGTGTLAASMEYLVAGKTGTAQKANTHGGGYMRGKYYSSFIGFASSDNPKIAVYVGIDEPSGGMYYGGQVAAPPFREIVDATLHYLKVPSRITVATNNSEAELLPHSQTAELALVEKAGGEPPQVIADGDSSWRLPDLRGLTMRGVLEASKEADIAWRFKGSGVAVNQSCVAGSLIAAGTECQVEFAPLM